MQIPNTELRQDIVQVSTHPIVFWFDKFIHELANESMPVSANNLFNKYKNYCNDININSCANVSAFGLIFKDNIPLDTFAVKKRTNNGQRYTFDKQKAHDWLKENNHTNYENTCNLQPDEESDGEI